MKLFEFAFPKSNYDVRISVSEQQLDELNLKHAATAGALALSTGLGNPNLPPNSERTQPASHVAQAEPQAPAQEPQKKTALDPKLEKLSGKIVKKYGIDSNLADEIVQLAKKHERKGFPKAEDLLAIIGIESSFNPNAVSGLRTDPAVGLTQIRPNVWGLDANSLRGDIDQQIKTSADILSKYRKKLKNTEDAIHAYNVGITAFQRGDYNPSYVEKFKDERRQYF
jgi:soluble lytic murein transglycosylase-like protein